MNLYALASNLTDIPFSRIIFLFIGLISFGQIVLFVDENDNISDNSETVTSTHEEIAYNNFNFQEGEVAEKCT